MTLTAPLPETLALPGGGRDRAVDVTRVGLLAIVVMLHALMAGVTRGPDGAPVFENALEGWDGFAALTWVAQIMPLFFILGGFAGRVQWLRVQDRGGSASDFIAVRMRRLLQPAVWAVGAVAAFLLALVIAGMPAELVATAGFRISQPFWFLAVYVGVTALVPLISKLHDSHRWVTFGVLGAGAAAVDAVRLWTEIPAIGLMNMLFVWLLLQQVGFSLADGTFDRLVGRQRVLIGAVALFAMTALVVLGIAPANLIAALNPPMSILVVLGVVQLMVFLTLRPRLRQWGSRPGIARIVDVVGARSMTVYAWHMLVMIVLAGALFLSPLPLPELLSASWWLTRGAWIGVVFAAVALTVWGVGQAEARRDRGMSRVRPQRAVTAAVAACAGLVVVVAFGSAPAAWVIAMMLLAASLRLASTPARKAVEKSIPMPCGE